MYIPDNLWAQIKDKLVETTNSLCMGDVYDFRNFAGAVIDKASFKKLAGYLEEARRSDQAEIIAGGEADDSVPVEESRKMYAALQAAGANVKYTEYPGVGHKSWDKAYAEPELVPWLLSQRLLH